MSYYYGYRRRRRLPYRYRVSAYRRRRAFARRMALRRRRYKRRTRPNKYLKFMPNTRLGKRLTYRRKSLGLHPLRLKKHEIAEISKPWVIPSLQNWSYYKNLDILPYDADSQEINVRTSHNINILPHTIRLTFHLNTDQEARYRVMLIKLFGQKPDYANMASINPQEILQLEGTYLPPRAMIANYTLNDEESTTNDQVRGYPFKVLYDRLITRDTTVEPQNFNFSIKVPARNVEYDPVVQNGTNSRNAICLAILTEGVIDNGNNITLKTMYKFIDGN